MIKYYILYFFQSLLNKRELLSQYWNTKILFLKKSEKKNYTKVKVWYSISLLFTLNKTLETVIADRLLYIVKIYTLLFINHFKVRKQQFTE